MRLPGYSIGEIVAQEAVRDIAVADDDLTSESLLGEPSVEDSTTQLSDLPAPADAAARVELATAADALESQPEFVTPQQVSSDEILASFGGASTETADSGDTVEGAGTIEIPDASESSDTDDEEKPGRPLPQDESASPDRQSADHDVAEDKP